MCWWPAFHEPAATLTSHCFHRNPLGIPPLIQGFPAFRGRKPSCCNACIQDYKDIQDRLAAQERAQQRDDRPLKCAAAPRPPSSLAHAACPPACPPARLCACPAAPAVARTLLCTASSCVHLVPLRCMPACLPPLHSAVPAPLPLSCLPLSPLLHSGAGPPSTLLHSLACRSAPSSIRVPAPASEIIDHCTVSTQHHRPGLRAAAIPAGRSRSCRRSLSTGQSEHWGTHGRALAALGHPWMPLAHRRASPLQPEPPIPAGSSGPGARRPMTRWRGWATTRACSTWCWMW